MSLTKRPISNTILDNLKSHYGGDFEFFMIFKNAKGTRFTGKGLDLSKELWKVYTIKLPEQYKILNKTLLLLDERMSWPYYLSKRQLVLFNEMDAFEFTLYQGDINLWANKF
jgi:hypothetical protein